MKIEFEDRTWQLEIMDADMTQADVIAGYTGLSLMAWYRSLMDTESVAWNKSVRCLYWLMRDQNDDAVPLDQALNFQPMVLLAAFNDALEATAAPETPAEEDPTKPAGEPVATEPTA